MDDLKGLKIRVTGAHTRFIKALGGIPAGMPMVEAYEAMQKGVVDGIIGTVDTLKTFKHADVTKYSTDCQVVGLTQVVDMPMNLNTWNSLPADIQKTIEEVSREYLPIIAKAWGEITLDGRAYALSRGHTFISISKEEEGRWKEAVKPILEDYIKQMQAKGLPGKEAVDEVIRLVEKYKSTK